MPFTACGLGCFVFSPEDLGQRRAPGVRQREADSAGDHVPGYRYYCGREVRQP